MNGTLDVLVDGTFASAVMREAYAKGWVQKPKQEQLTDKQLMALQASVKRYRRKTEKKSAFIQELAKG